MQGIALAAANTDFLNHRARCAICASSGPGLCPVGLQLIGMFEAVLKEAIAQELQAEERSMA